MKWDSGSNRQSGREGRKVCCQWTPTIVPRPDFLYTVEPVLT